MLCYEYYKVTPPSRHDSKELPKVTLVVEENKPRRAHKVKQHMEVTDNWLGDEEDVKTASWGDMNDPNDEKQKTPDKIVIIFTPVFNNRQCLAYNILYFSQDFGFGIVVTLGASVLALPGTSTRR